MKMRGSDHDKHLREYEITSKGFKVRSSFGAYEGLMTGTPRKSAPAENFATAFATAARKQR